MQINEEIVVNPTKIGSHQGSVVYFPTSFVSLLAIISQLSNQLIIEREQWKTQKKSLNQVINNHYQNLMEKEEEVEQLKNKLTKVTSMIPKLMS